AGVMMGFPAAVVGLALAGEAAAVPAALLGRTVGILAAAAAVRAGGVPPPVGQLATRVVNAMIARQLKWLGAPPRLRGTPPGRARGGPGGGAAPAPPAGAGERTADVRDRQGRAGRRGPRPQRPEGPGVDRGGEDLPRPIRGQAPDLGAVAGPQGAGRAEGGG